MADPIRYAVLDHSVDEANLWELPWSLSEKSVEVHPRRTVAEVRPVLVQLLMDGHAEMYVDHSLLELDAALAAVAADANWTPATAAAMYVVTLTDSGVEEFHRERAEAGGA